MERSTNRIKAASLRLIDPAPVTSFGTPNLASKSAVKPTKCSRVLHNCIGVPPEAWIVERIFIKVSGIAFVPASASGSASSGKVDFFLD